LITLWLKYKSFDVFEITKSADAVKRNKVSAVIDQFDFGSIEELIKACNKAIGVDVN
jgi:hypothetical protein